MAFMTEARDDYKLELAAEMLRAGGGVRLRALGNSMLPSIWPGDVLCIERKAGEEMVAGDIVLVARGGRFFIHRLIEKRDSGWITRGDALPQNDEAVAEASVLGKVALVQRKGAVLVPGSRISWGNRALAWMLCHWDLFRNIALRMHLLYGRQLCQ